MPLLGYLETGGQRRRSGPSKDRRGANAHGKGRKGKPHEAEGHHANSGNGRSTAVAEVPADSPTDGTLPEAYSGQSASSSTAYRDWTFMANAAAAAAAQPTDSSYIDPGVWDHLT